MAWRARVGGKRSRSRCAAALNSPARVRLSASGTPLQEDDGVCEVALALLALLERPAPKPALRGVAALEGQDYGQGDLAVTEIVADALAEHDFARAVVQHVIDQLKGNAEILAIATQSFDVLPGALADHRADLRRRGEQGSGLGGDHLEIAYFVGLGVVGGHQLRDLALRDHRRRVGEIASTSSEPSSTISWKARENRKSPTSTLGLLPQMALAVASPTQPALVDHVIVQQRRRVNELDRRRERHCRPPR